MTRLTFKIKNQIKIFPLWIILRPKTKENYISLKIIITQKLIYFFIFNFFIKKGFWGFGEIGRAHV